jgi:DNA-binding winged helix-turn-helix (wHTH) protein
VVVRFGSFVLAAETRLLTRAGEPLHLTPKAFDLLTVLVEAAPRVVPKHALHTRLWPDSFVADTTLVGLVKEVRRVLGDADPAAPIIRTVMRIGYAFAAPLVAAEPAPAAAAAAHWLVADGRSYPLYEGENSIGRDAGSVVWLDSGGVSRRHAAITIAGSEAALADLGSKNGTTVNGVELRESLTLRDGDRLFVGTVPLTYRSSRAALSTETQVSATHVAPAFER